MFYHMFFCKSFYTHVKLIKNILLTTYVITEFIFYLKIKRFTYNRLINVLYTFEYVEKYELKIRYIKLIYQKIIADIIYT